MKKEELYKKAGRKFGDESEFLKCIEEMSELTKELCKYYLNGNSLERHNKIREEIADVKIMLEQLEETHFGLVLPEMQEKLKRLALRLNIDEEIEIE